MRACCVACLAGRALAEREDRGRDDAQRQRQQDAQGRRRPDALTAAPFGGPDLLPLAGQALLLQAFLDAGAIRRHGRGDLAAVRRTVGLVRGQAPLGQLDQLRIRPAAGQPGRRVPSRRASIAWSRTDPESGPT